jgi:hypothetical protein
MSSWRRSYSSPSKVEWTTKKSGKRRRIATLQNLNIREVQKPEGEIHEYRVYIKTEASWATLTKIDEELTQWVKSCLSGQFKMYRTRCRQWSCLTSIKLESESDLMMFMLCHREHVRKIFRMVDEPTKGSSAVNV